MSGTVFLLSVLPALLGVVFFAGSETGVLSVDIHRIRQAAKEGSRPARRLLGLLAEREKLLATLLIGNNLAVVSVSALTTSFLAGHIQRGELAALASVIVVTPVILIVGEMFPKNIYLHIGEPLLLKSVWILQACQKIFSPVTLAVLVLPRLFIRDDGESPSQLTREEFRSLIHTGALHQQVPEEEKHLIRRLIDFKEKRAVSIMVPLLDAVSVAATETVRTAIGLMHRNGFSRLPVYRQKTDRIVGIVTAMDCLNIMDPDIGIATIMRTPAFVPEQARIPQLLDDILQGKEFTVVVDEYGVATGIITAEDVLERIVGDIRDEFDIPETIRITPLTRGVMVVDAGISLEELSERQGIRIPPGDYTTLAGFLITAMQKIPERGDDFDWEGLRFTILEVENQRITRVIIRKMAQPIGENER